MKKFRKYYSTNFTSERNGVSVCLRYFSAAKVPIGSAFASELNIFDILKRSNMVNFFGIDFSWCKNFLKIIIKILFRLRLIEKLNFEMIENFEIVWKFFFCKQREVQSHTCASVR